MLLCPACTLWWAVSLREKGVSERMPAPQSWGGCPMGPGCPPTALTKAISQGASPTSGLGQRAPSACSLALGRSSKQEKTQPTPPRMPFQSGCHGPRQGRAETRLPNPLCGERPFTVLLGCSEGSPRRDRALGYTKGRQLSTRMPRGPQALRMSAGAWQLCSWPSTGAHRMFSSCRPFSQRCNYGGGSAESGTEGYRKPLEMSRPLTNKPGIGGGVLGRATVIPC